MVILLNVVVHFLRKGNLRDKYWESNVELMNDMTTEELNLLKLTIRNTKKNQEISASGCPANGKKKSPKKIKIAEENNEYRYYNHRECI